MASNGVASNGVASISNGLLDFCLCCLHLNVDLSRFQISLNIGGRVDRLHGFSDGIFTGRARHSWDGQLNCHAFNPFEFATVPILESPVR